MTQTVKDAGPLDGVRVLDLTAVIMGPFATQILGDLGAEVITVEPRGGDIARTLDGSQHPEFSGVSLNLLRNKRNIQVNFKSPRGREIILALAKTCDVVVTNQRPGVAARARLTYEDFRTARDDIIYCSAHGYRSDSEQADDPAYDDILQAASGLADASRKATGEALLAPTVLADKLCGISIVYAVTAALFARERTGCGDHVEIPMLDTTRAFILVEHGAAAICLDEPGPVGYRRILTPERRPQRTLDGWVCVLPYSTQNYDDLFSWGGRWDLLGDSRYQGRWERVQHSDFLYGQVRVVLAERTTAEALQFCRIHGIPAGEVADLEQLVDALPEAKHPYAGRYKVIPPPLRFENHPMSLRRQAPLIGEHSTELLLEAGYDETAIEDLITSGIVGDAKRAHD
jgi:crotonobetainyl-CoA:carnitine CoA-transferase CaiB-like acyl-CoA transferase